ncbi:BA14K family protein [Methylobacterium sp. E-066]|uniref:BA14K family protein n=1 Tax=Methylobacterium sp. E-066 TaxID=2836584 RepID=UPI001FB9C266|nr:BA14K family protein [Methylobacterium sp. E-066]MCJ2139689.1 BA14K family protein [Methylobacterium sp. E-066]
MARIDRSTLLLVATAVIALPLTMTGAEARGFGGGFHGGVGTRIGAWGRPLGPVRPGPAIIGGRPYRPGFAFRHPYTYRPWYGGYYGYGLAGLGLGFGLGSLWGDFGDPFYDDAYIYAPRVYRPPVYVAPADVPPVVEADPADLPAAVAACARRFRTYDPATQTFIGKGYVRRHCP